MKRKTTVIDPHGQPFNVSYSHRREGLILVDYKYKPDPETTIRLFNVTHEASGYQMNGNRSGGNQENELHGIGWNHYEQAVVIDFIANNSE